MYVSWPSLREMRFSELRNMQREEKKEKGIKGKKKYINNRKPVFKLYIIYYSATHNLSPDICYCGVRHVSKPGRCRIRES